MNGMSGFGTLLLDDDFFKQDGKTAYIYASMPCSIYPIVQIRFGSPSPSPAN